jgi:signal transduction histidine kinase
MPELDGFELAAMIRQHPRYEKTAIIFISAILQTDLDRLRGYESGAVDYIHVPIVPELLRAKVRIFVDLYRKTRQLERINAELEARVASRTTELETAAARLRENEETLQQLLEQEKAARAEAQAASWAKDEFLALVSHELRTPLNAILGWARMLQSDTLDAPTARRAIEVIDRNARSQAQLIEDLLDFSRIASGRLRLEVRETELAPLIAAAIEVVRPAAEAKQIQIQCVLDPTCSPVSGDPERLKQILWNLLSNAVKFTPDGGRVDVQLRRDGAHSELVVTDTGQGIRPDFLPHVFEHFRQGDPSTTKRHGGLGLGLAIVRHLVELHGGMIRAESDGEGKGAVFTVRLPSVAGRDGVTRSALTPFVADRPFLGSAKIPYLGPLRALVVDDDADSREMLAMVLTQCDVDVEMAGSVAEAMEAFRRRPPDLLISDIGMPGEDGFVLIERVRALAPHEGGRVPAIALTAYARVEDRVRVLGAGFQMHLPKPVEPIELVAVVGELARRAID